MDILNSYIELIYGFDITDNYVRNQITRVIGYLQDNKYTDEEIMHYLIHNGPVISDDMFTTLTQCVVYYNNELVIESPAPIWHPEKQNNTVAYYREPKCNFTMDDLLNLYYSNLKVPYELQDKKRDAGAFEHMLNKYKFKEFTTLDYVVTLIKLSADNNETAISPFSLEKYNEEAYNMLTTLAQYAKTTIIWREK